METPSSLRRLTRSQTKASVNSIPMSKKNDESGEVLSRQKNAKSDRSALLDITNDSPIVGLALGNLETPSSHFKKLEQSKRTPGSGEALLRYQVKTLLQKVEEESELSKSRSGILAPALENTPHVLNLSVNGVGDGFISETQSEVEESKTQKISTPESQKSVIARLLFDSSEKSKFSDSSSSPCSSIWSIQVNPSTKTEDEEEEIDEVEEEDYEEEGEEYEGGGEEDGVLDELCEGLSKIYVQEKKIPEFAGKHTRFIYNSEDEIEGEQEILHLKGVPTPQGKHLRFSDEEEA